MRRAGVLLPEALTVRMRAGTKARLAARADAEAVTMGAWARAAIERALETDERRLRAQAQREREAQR